jgi:hypothetical protein
MPVRSLASSVLRWPDAAAIDAALRRWAAKTATPGRDVERIGYFGSYARGNWGVGSDLDVVLIVAKTDTPFERRAAGWPTDEIPVPVDILVYTVDEWQRMTATSPLVAGVVRDVVWVYKAR